MSHNLIVLFSFLVISNCNYLYILIFGFYTSFFATFPVCLTDFSPLHCCNTISPPVINKGLTHLIIVYPKFSDMTSLPLIVFFSSLIHSM